VIVVDTSGLLAALDDSERHHQAAKRTLRAAGAPVLLSPFVLAELDYLLSTRISSAAARHFLQDVADRAYQLEPFGPDDIGDALAVLNQYADLDVGLADASIVVLADRHSTRDLLSLDERHFRALRNARGQPFRLLPLDATA